MKAIVVTGEDSSQVIYNLIHHLMAEMNNLALETNNDIDTCNDLVAGLRGMRSPLTIHNSNHGLVTAVMDLAAQRFARITGRE